MIIVRIRTSVHNRGMRLFIFGILLFSQKSMAGFFLEPYVGISKFEQRQDSSGFVSKDIADGFHLAVRGGYQFGKTWFLGGEYFRGGPYKFEDQFFGSTESENSLIMIGGTIGGDFDIIRVSVGYFPEHDMTTSGTSTTIIGSAIRVGFGLKVGKKIRANLDVFFQNMDKQVFANGTEADIDPKIEGELAAVSVSFPFELN